MPEPGPRPRARLHLRAGRLSCSTTTTQPRRSTTDASKAAVAVVPGPVQGRPRHDRRPTSGDDWCGEALGKGRSPSIFEGGWLDPFMNGTYPDVKYAWAEMPTGSSGKPSRSRYTVQLLDRCRLGRTRTRRWVLLSYLTGPDGMTKWTEGGVALPVALGRRRRRPARTSSSKGSAYAKPGRASCPATATSRRRSRTRSRRRSRARPTTPAPVVAATKAHRHCAQGSRRQ